MQCKTCGYRLWNLRSRQCPECGAGFLVGDFEFVPGAVQFCCPHCDNAYYGTSERGLLVPRQFSCVQCAQAIDMESMVLRPADGVDEAGTQVATIPWLKRREIGFWRSLFKTVSMSLFHPSELLRGDHHPNEGGAGWSFAAWVLVLMMLVNSSLVLVMQLGMMVTFVPGGVLGGLGGTELLIFLTSFLFTAVFGVLVSLLSILIWGLATHGFLRMTGDVRYPLSGTFRALCYSTGASTASLVPCIGWYFGWIWWLVSAVAMVRETQRASGARAAFAVLTLPLVTIMVIVGFYAWFIVSVFSTAGAGFAPGGGMMFGGSTFAHNETHAMVSTYLDYSREHGALPAHPLQLLLDDRAYSTEFVSSDTMTTTDQIVWSTLALTDLDHMTESGRQKRIAAFVEQLPENAIAHRVGDYVFTCPGIDPATLTPDVWLVIQTPMPATGSAQTGIPQTGFPPMVHVGLADGSVLAIPKQTFQNSLQGQISVRKNNNLPPLPKLSSITHAQPAVRDAAVVED